MAEVIESTDLTTVQRVTAAQIEKECPERLQQIGKEIAQRLARADKQTRIAQDHLIAIEQLLAEAKALCDGGGFSKFREQFCPELGKSQAYALLAIAAGKKTMEEHLAEGRERKQRSRAKRRATVQNSGTVPEKSEPPFGPEEAPASEAEANSALERVEGKIDSASAAGAHQEAPASADKVEAASTASEKMPEPAKPRSAVTLNDQALFGFSRIVAELLRRIDKREANRFTGTSITADDLAKIGMFFTDLANLKKSVAKPIGLAAVRGNSTVATEQSVEDLQTNKTPEPRVWAA